MYYSSKNCKNNIETQRRNYILKSVWVDILESKVIGADALTFYKFEQFVEIIINSLFPNIKVQNGHHYNLYGMF